MTHGKAVRLITAWEFRRFLRFRDLLTMVIMTVVFGVGLPYLFGLFAGGDEEVITLAQTGGAPIVDSERFEFVPLDLAAAQAALAEEDVEGIIDASDPEAPVLTVESESAWIGPLNEHLVSSALGNRLDAAGIESSEFEALLAPVDLQVQVTEQSEGPGDTVVILIVSGLMIFVIFLGTGTLFSAITGEKTNRVTEQIVSAVSPQAWIDGKVLGTAGYMLVYLLTLVIGIILAVLVNFLIAGDGIPPLPPLPAANPAVIITAMVFGLLGTALYFMLFAAVAATIDDPNTSQRSGIIMLPGLFIGMSFLGLIGDVDNLFFRAISYIPLTSPSAMPIRLLTGDAGWVEVIISLLVLTGSVWFARIIAGRIFRLGILMTGKEPTWTEMLHWLRRT